MNDELAAAGLRVLAVASGPVASSDERALRDLTFVGFVGIQDPPAPGVKATIARLREAGLRTIMITGDQRLTARAIGRELGLLESDAQVIDGRDLHQLTPDELVAQLATVGAFSRVTPEDKLTIVAGAAGAGRHRRDARRRRERRGRAQEGGRRASPWASAARTWPRTPRPSCSQDDRFETIAAAVEEGRIVFDNIRKFVFYLFSCNLAEVLVLLVGGPGRTAVAAAAAADPLAQHGHRHVPGAGAGRRAWRRRRHAAAAARSTGSAPLPGVPRPHRRLCGSSSRAPRSRPSCGASPTRPARPRR